MRPHTWRAYADDTRAADNAATVVAWLAVPASQRPRFATLYLDQVDEASHEHGPDSPQAQAARAEVDAALGELLHSLQQRGLRDAVNLVVVSDHGFASVPPDQRKIGRAHV